MQRTLTIALVGLGLFILILNYWLGNSMTMLRAFLEEQNFAINMVLKGILPNSDGFPKMEVSEENVARMVVLSPIDSIKLCFKEGGIKRVLFDLFTTSLLPWKLLWYVFVHDVGQEAGE